MPGIVVTLVELAPRLAVAPEAFDATLAALVAELRDATIDVGPPWPVAKGRAALTRDKEQDLARCHLLLTARVRDALFVDAAKSRVSVSSPVDAAKSRVSVSTADLLALDAPQGAAGDRARRCQLELRQLVAFYVEQTGYLVAAITRRYFGLGVDGEDLLQEGFMGLLRAIDGYDWRRGVRFATYAKYWIQERVLKAVYDQARTVRLPAWIQKTWHKLRRRAADLGPSDAPADVTGAAGEMDLTGERLQRIIDSRRTQISLDAAWDEGGEVRTVLASLAVPDYASDRQSVRAALDAVLAELTEREAMVVRRRFGLGGGEPETLQQIGTDLGLTAERVRQIEAAVLRRLREHGRIQGLRDAID